MKRISRIQLVTGLILFVVMLLTKCTSVEEKKPTTFTPAVDFTAFAGSASCASCHRDVYEKHLHTEHYSSTSKASAEKILGSFEQGKNQYVFDNGATVVMQGKDSGFYQTEYANGQVQKSERIDMIVGSGRKGQSYINVNGNRFTQLPITYFTAAAQWSNSPGYPPHNAAFERPITSRCLECHTTFVQQVKSTSPGVEEFDKTKIIYGIDCERCHGPAARHVAFQTQNPKVTEAKFIVNPAKLSRQQNLDLCSLCHGGRLQKKTPSFSFQVGDSLTGFFAPNKNFMDATNIDVHGNQAGLLSASNCFRLSQLTCNSCHNAHENEKDKIALFSQRCQTCHSSGHQKICKLTDTIGTAITQNCIDCHMPKQASRSIAVYLQGAQQPTPVFMRTHWIKIYPEETDKVKNLLKATRAKGNLNAKEIR